MSDIQPPRALGMETTSSPDPAPDGARQGYIDRVEALATEHGIKPEAVWAQLELDDLLTDTGNGVQVNERLTSFLFSHAMTAAGEWEDSGTIDPAAPTAEGVSREAAKYRRQLRVVEAERDALQQSVIDARTALANHYASASRIKPQALWASGVGIDDLLDDDGMVSAELVTAACDKAASMLGLSRSPKPDPSIGRGGGETSSAFSGAFRLR